MPQPNVPQVATLSALHGGYNGYTDPVLLSPQFWAAAAYVYSGQFGTIRRTRYASVNGPGGGSPVISAFDFRDSTPENLVLSDIGGYQYSSPSPFGTSTVQRVSPYFQPGSSTMQGPWFRNAFGNMVYETNGKFNQRGIGAKAQTIQKWGLDAPDASPGVVTSSGGITLTVGRSYRYAWVNDTIANTGAPSPATQYVLYSSQQGTINCIEPGTVTTSTSSNQIGGSGTAFTSAWVGRRIWIAGLGGGAWSVITSVSSEMILTVQGPVPSNLSGVQYTIYDPQSTAIKLYATGDGGSIYFLLGSEQAFNPSGTSLSAAGLQFTDDNNVEPPTAPFSSEQAQLYNLPPPVSAYSQPFMGNAITFGIEGFPQGFFYSNSQLTTIGVPTECFAPLNQVLMPFGDGVMSGMAQIPTGCIMWSDRHDMFKLTGTLTDNTVATASALGSYIQQLPYSIGCANPWVVQVTNLGAIWLSSDREVWLYTDRYAPRNIGKPIQDLLDEMGNTSTCRSVYYKTEDFNWYVLLIPSNGSSTPNLACILDLDLLASNGSPSFFTFDMATNQPSWWTFPINSQAIVAAFDDGSGSQRLLAADQAGNYTDIFWDGESNVTAEQQLPNSSITFHALGNDMPEAIKGIGFLRFITNRAPGQLQQDGWSFFVNSIDDDVYTFDSPLVTWLNPGIDSTTASSPLQNGPDVFRLGGAKYAIGRRFKFGVNFPSQVGQTYELKEIQVSYRVKYIR